MAQSVRSDEQRSSPTASDEQISELNSTAFGAFVLELLQSQELVSEFNKHRDDPASCDVRKARQALGGVIAEMFAIPLNDRLRATIERVIRVEKKSDRAVELLQQLVNDRFQIEQIVFDGEAQHRFKNEYPEEKKAIAQHVAVTYFKSPLHCFLQASTTAFHVVEALHNGRFGRGSVIHTNSFAVPYLLLGKGRDHSSFFSVYPISGDVKDYLCDGWLYTSNDQVANTYVRSLFERPHYRIQKVFLTPQFVDVEGKCYFGREETIPLFETALEMAEEVVVLTPGPRILPDRRLLPSNSQISWSESRIRRNGKTKALNWVVGGETKSLTADGKEQFLATCKSLSSDVAWV